MKGNANEGMEAVMLGLEVRNDGTRWMKVNKNWRTMNGVENYISNALKRYQWLTADDFRITGTEETRRKPRNTMNAPSMDVYEGDVFMCSWGYSMSLVDFYQVVKVSKTGKSVNVRKLATRIVDGGCICSPEGAHVVPIMDCFVGDELKNKHIKGDYSAKHKPMFSVDGCGWRYAHLMEQIDPNGYYTSSWD